MAIAIAFLIARLILGLGFAAHGAQKLFGVFGGYGINGTASFFETIGFRPGTTFAVLAGVGELVGGLLTALGLFGALGPALMISVMLVSILTVHLEHGFFAQNNGWELAGAYIAGALMLAFAGFGVYSLDALFGIAVFSSPRVAWALIGIGVIIALIVSLVRRPVPTPVARS
jgi:putative oxidoreductase